MMNQTLSLHGYVRPRQGRCTSGSNSMHQTARSEPDIDVSIYDVQMRWLDGMHASYENSVEFTGLSGFDRNRVPDMHMWTLLASGVKIVIHVT